MIGTYVLSHGYYDAYYLQAQKMRRMIADDFRPAFTECDVIAGPVAPTVAWKLGEHGNDPVADYLADIFTLPASLAGLPGMSVPVRLRRRRHAGGPAADRQLLPGRPLLNAAHAFQQATDFHLRAAGGLVMSRARPRLRSRDRPRDPRPAVHPLQDLQPRVDRTSAPRPTPRPARSTWRCPARCR